MMENGARITWKRDSVNEVHAGVYRVGEMRIVATSGYAVCLSDRDVSDGETGGETLNC